MSNTFVISWDMFGVETVINVSDIEKRTMWSSLKGEETSRDPSVNQIVSMMMMRARINSQRHYEIYAIDTEDSIDEKQLRKHFEDDPQGMADLIRERGRLLHDGRSDTGRVVIR
jgi:hypothetical protein